MDISSRGIAGADMCGFAGCVASYKARATSRPTQQTRGIGPMLGWCWPSSTTLAQHQPNISPMPRVCWVYTWHDWCSFLPHEPKRQYLFTLQVRRYCLLALPSSTPPPPFDLRTPWWKCSSPCRMYDPAYYHTYNQNSILCISAITTYFVLLHVYKLLPHKIDMIHINKMSVFQEKNIIFTLYI